MKFLSFLNPLIDLFYPKVCLGCEAILLAQETIICTQCRHEIPLTDHLENIENEAKLKFYGRVDVEFVATLLYFHKQGSVQELIHNLKYRGHQEIGTLFGKWFGEDLKNVELLKSVDAIIPVPLHPKKLKIRGYNQVDTFAKAIAESLNKPFDDSILKRTKFSKTQVFKNRADRSKVLENVFDVDFTEKENNKHFLLIDDVLTSGATLEACIRALQKIPNTKVSVVCIAMTD